MATRYQVDGVDSDILAPAFSEALTQAHRVAQDFSSVVELEDVEQELFAWVLSNQKVVARYLDPENEQGRGKLRASLRNAARKYCLKVKMDAIGASVDDLYWYSQTELRGLLEDMYDYERWPEGPNGEDQAPRRARSRPAEGGNRVAMLSDCSRAVAQLSQDDQLILQSYFGTRLPLASIAKIHEVTPSAITQRVNRAVTRVQKILGGKQPQWQDYADHEGPGARRVMSNAESRARTEDQ